MWGERRNHTPSREELQRVIVDQPGPGVMRMRAALTEARTLAAFNTSPISEAQAKSANAAGE